MVAIYALPWPNVTGGGANNGPNGLSTPFGSPSLSASGTPSSSPLRKRPGVRVDFSGSGSGSGSYSADVQKEGAAGGGALGGAVGGGLGGGGGGGPSEPQLLLELSQLDNRVYACALHPDATRVAFGGVGKEVLVWDIESNSEVQRLYSGSNVQVG